MTNVVIWNEYVHEQEDEHVRSIYPNGIHGCIKDFLSEDKNLNIQTATLDQTDHGLSEDLLEKTDVLVWWGHKAHNLVEDRIVDRVQQRVLEGMGLLVLHSGHHSKIFRKLMGTTANLRWAERGEKERVWVCNPGHPIAEGLGEYFEIEMTEMYGEPFQVPSPDETVFLVGLKVGKYFVQDFVTKEETVRFSILDLVMSLIQFIIIKMFRELLKIQFIGFVLKKHLACGLIKLKKKTIMVNERHLSSPLK